MRAGTVAIIGRTNVGKSTFLNAAIGERLAIVSPRPQTTRDAILGVYRTDSVEIAFTDTPGLHRPKSELGRRMNSAAVETSRSADAVLFVTDCANLRRARAAASVPEDDAKLLRLLPPQIPVVLVINKVDKLRDKGRLLPWIEAFHQLREFTATIPAAVQRGEGVSAIIQELGNLLPEAAPTHAPDTLTDRPTTFFVREYVREQTLLQLDREVPHAVAVTCESFETGGRTTVIRATIHVEKISQRAILVGKGGSRIKEIGTQARTRLEELIGTPIHLELFVRVTERWKNTPRQLAELGYDREGLSLSNLLPARPSVRRTAKKVSRKRVERSPGRSPARPQEPTRPKPAKKRARKKARKKTVSRPR